jgi:hypothetical protein
VIARVTAPPRQPTYLENARWWLLATGLMLMLPRQWPSVGIAFALGLLCHLVVRLRQRRA